MAPRSPRAAATITIHRAPVLTLWAAVVAERLGFDRAEALTLGRPVAAVRTAEGVRALQATGRPASPEAVERYLAKAFGESLEDERAMAALARR